LKFVCLKNPLLTGALRKDFLRLILQKIALLSRLFKISGRRGWEKRRLPLTIFSRVLF